jgi:hypothetical protein
MAIGNPTVYADFSGGVNKEAGPYLLQDNQCQDARNVYANPLGSLEKRRGFASFSTLSALDGPAHSLAPLSLSPTRYLLAVGKEPSQSKDRIVSVSENGTATAIKSGLEENTRWEFVQALAGGGQGPIYGVNGVDNPQYWSGATASTATADWTAIDDTGTAITPHPAKKCKFLVYHLDTIWASGDTDNPGTVFSSGVTSSVPDFRNWSTRYRDRVDPGDGQNITGLGKVGPYLLVFKNRKTYVLTNATPEARAYRPISSSIGCVSHRSIAETTRGTMFLSEDLGVCLTDGSSVQRISDAIQPFLKDIMVADAEAIKNAAAVYYDDSYWLSLPVSGTNAVTLQFSLETDSWWIHTCASNQFALLDPAGQPRLYSAQPSTKRVERAFAPDTYLDAGVTYESYWEGPFWAWGEPHINKRLHQLRADGSGYWKLKIKEDFNRPYSAELDDEIWGPEYDLSAEKYGEGDADWGDPDTSIIFGGTQGLQQRRYNTPARGWGRAWSLRLSDNLSNVPMQIYAISAFVRTRTD